MLSALWLYHYALALAVSVRCDMCSLRVLSHIRIFPCGLWRCGYVIVASGLRAGPIRNSWRVGHRLFAVLVDCVARNAVALGHR